MLPLARAELPPGGSGALGLASCRPDRAADGPLSAAAVAEAAAPVLPEPPPHDDPEALPGPLPAAAAPATLRPRHWGALASLVLLVLLPFAAATAYLYGRAADQYHSEVAFSVRSEEVGSAAAGLLGALTQVGSGTATDADILYDYIRSQEIVEAVDAELDLRAIWNRPGSGWEDGDPVFTLGDDPTHRGAARASGCGWSRSPTTSTPASSTSRPTPSPPRTRSDRRGDARRVEPAGEHALRRAREDAVRFARAELAEAEAHLAEVRQRARRLPPRAQPRRPLGRRRRAERAARTR